MFESGRPKASPRHRMSPRERLARISPREQLARMSPRGGFSKKKGIKLSDEGIAPSPNDLDAEEESVYSFSELPLAPPATTMTSAAPTFDNQALKQNSSSYSSFSYNSSSINSNNNNNNNKKTVSIVADDLQSTREGNTQAFNFRGALGRSTSSVPPKSPRMRQPSPLRKTWNNISYLNQEHGSSLANVEDVEGVEAPPKISRHPSSPRNPLKLSGSLRAIKVKYAEFSNQATENPASSIAPVDTDSVDSGNHETRKTSSGGGSPLVKQANIFKKSPRYKPEWQLKRNKILGEKQDYLSPLSARRQQMKKQGLKQDKSAYEEGGIFQPDFEAQRRGSVFWPEDMENEKHGKKRLSNSSLKKQIPSSPKAPMPTQIPKSPSVGSAASLAPSTRDSPRGRSSRQSQWRTAREECKTSPASSARDSPKSQSSRHQQWRTAKEESPVQYQSRDRTSSPESYRQLSHQKSSPSPRSRRSASGAAAYYHLGNKGRHNRSPSPTPIRTTNVSPVETFSSESASPVSRVEVTQNWVSPKHEAISENISEADQVSESKIATVSIVDAPDMFLPRHEIATSDVGTKNVTSYQDPSEPIDSSKDEPVCEECDSSELEMILSDSNLAPDATASTSGELDMILNDRTASTSGELEMILNDSNIAPDPTNSTEFDLPESESKEMQGELIASKDEDEKELTSTEGENTEFIEGGNQVEETTAPASPKDSGKTESGSVEKEDNANDDCVHSELVDKVDKAKDDCAHPGSANKESHLETNDAKTKEDNKDQSSSENKIETPRNSARRSRAARLRLMRAQSPLVLKLEASQDVLKNNLDAASAVMQDEKESSVGSGGSDRSCLSSEELGNIAAKALGLALLSKHGKLRKTPLNHLLKQMAAKKEKLSNGVSGDSTEKKKRNQALSDRASKDKPTEDKHLEGEKEAYLQSEKETEKPDDAKAKSSALNSQFPMVSRSYRNTRLAKKYLHREQNAPGISNSTDESNTPPRHALRETPAIIKSVPNPGLAPSKNANGEVDDQSPASEVEGGDAGEEKSSPSQEAIHPKTSTMSDTQKDGADNLVMVNSSLAEHKSVVSATACSSTPPAKVSLISAVQNKKERRALLSGAARPDSGSKNTAETLTAKATSDSIDSNMQSPGIKTKLTQSLRIARANAIVAKHRYVATHPGTKTSDPEEPQIELPTIPVNQTEGETPIEFTAATSTCTDIGKAESNDSSARISEALASDSMNPTVLNLTLSESKSNPKGDIAVSATVGSSEDDNPPKTTSKTGPSDDLFSRTAARRTVRRRQHPALAARHSRLVGKKTNTSNSTAVKEEVEKPSSEKTEGCCEEQSGDLPNSASMNSIFGDNKGIARAYWKYSHAKEGKNCKMS